MSRLSEFLRKDNGRPARAWRASRRGRAWLWRFLFVRTTFVAVTGSFGKTTASLLLARMLRTQARTYFRAFWNEPPDIWWSVLRAKPWRARYHVQEVSGHRPGVILWCLAVLRPSVGVVTAVSGDHRKSFGSFEATAAEKATLVGALPRDGLAVLNADDPFVNAMGASSPCRVVRFGSGADVDLRLVAAQSSWPERLSLEVEYKGRRHLVQTQLVGTHWSVSVMAALLTALEMGVPIDDCLATLGSSSPVYNRMSVHRSVQGTWYVLDAFKASFFGIETCLQFVAQASAPRKTVLFGTISDYPGSSKAHYYKAARMALKVADRVVFTGRNAERVRRLAAGEFAGRLFTSENPADALRIIQADPIPGELIYVKASKVDRIWRLLVPPGQKEAVRL